MGNTEYGFSVEEYLSLCLAIHWAKQKGKVFIICFCYEKVAESFSVGQKNAQSSQYV